MRLLAGLALLATLAAIPGGVRAQDVTIAPASVADRKAVFATVESVRVTPARARIAGTLAEVAVREGDQVQAGQRLGRVVDPKLALQMAAIRARSEAVRAEEELARVELERARELRATGAVAQARIDSAQAQLGALMANRAAVQAELAVIAQQASEGEVLAPAAGRVLRVRAVAGAVILPGEPVAEIATEHYVLRLALPERHARFLQAGDAVTVGGRGLDPAERPLGEGRITLVYPQIEAGRVIADVEAPGLPGFFVGERVRVFVAAGTRTTILLPEGHLLHRFGLTLARLKDGSEVVVQTGPATAPGMIEILSGLRAGDVVVRP